MAQNIVTSEKSGEPAGHFLSRSRALLESVFFGPIYRVQAENFIGIILLVLPVQLGHLVGKQQEDEPAKQEGRFPESTHKAELVPGSRWRREGDSST